MSHKVKPNQIDHSMIWQREWIWNCGSISLKIIQIFPNLIWLWSVLNLCIYCNKSYSFVVLCDSGAISVRKEKDVAFCLFLICYLSKVLHNRRSMSKNVLVFHILEGISLRTAAFITLIILFFTTASSSSFINYPGLRSNQVCYWFTHLGSLLF